MSVCGRRSRAGVRTLAVRSPPLVHGREPPDMLVARSPEECHLYMELQPCSCGEDGFTWSRHRQERRGDRLVSVYQGPCSRCSAQRRFEFEVPAVPPPPPAYGGEEPSRIVDPGEFYAVSAELAESVPDDPAALAPDDLDEAYGLVEMSVAALAEVLKFVPAGADAVPPEAFFTPGGRRVYQARPAEFGRDRLEALLADRRRRLAAYERASSR